MQANPTDIQKIREAIQKANSLQEVERLTKMLQSGQISSEFLSGKFNIINYKEYHKCIFVYYRRTHGYLIQHILYGIPGNFKLNSNLS